MEGGGYSAAGGWDLNEDEGDGTKRKRRKGEGKGSGRPADGGLPCAEGDSDEGGCFFVFFFHWSI